MPTLMTTVERRNPAPTSTAPVVVSTGRRKARSLTPPPTNKASKNSNSTKRSTSYLKSLTPSRLLRRRTMDRASVTQAAAATATTAVSEDDSQTCANDLAQASTLTSTPPSKAASTNDDGDESDDATADTLASAAQASTATTSVTMDDTGRLRPPLLLFQEGNDDTEHGKQQQNIIFRKTASASSNSLSLPKKDAAAAAAAAAGQSLVKAALALEEYIESAEERHALSGTIASALKGLHKEMDHVIHTTFSSAATADDDDDDDIDDDDDDDENKMDDERHASTVTTNDTLAPPPPREVAVSSPLNIHCNQQLRNGTKKRNATAGNSVSSRRGLPTEFYLLILAFLGMVVAVKYFAILVEPAYEKEVLFARARAYVSENEGTLNDIIAVTSANIQHDAQKPLKGMVVVMTETVSGLGSNVAHGLNILGATVASIKVDCNDLQSIAKSVDSIIERIEKVDFVVNTGNLCLWRTITSSSSSSSNTTTTPVPLVESPTVQGYEALFAGNYLAPFLMTQKLLPLLERSNFGTLVQFTSPTASFMVDGSHLQVDSTRPTVSVAPQGGMLGTIVSLPRRFLDVKLAEVLHVRILTRIYPNVRVLDISKDGMAAGRDVKKFFDYIFEQSKKSYEGEPSIWETLFFFESRPIENEELQDDFYDWSVQAVERWIGPHRRLGSSTSSVFHGLHHHHQQQQQTTTSQIVNTDHERSKSSTKVGLAASVTKYLNVGSTTLVVGGLSLLGWKLASGSLAADAN